eukprot:TRINITY_DN56134_c0_g1_i1.p1 TRINITY_DN56134_c0_g1~~TRINITY_DN56134_c0_g1_i1.p1  ORF type:complete len:482 (+),score=90.72 TRINITY_DN56134_c0_g1_i1:129-1448(+)
MPAAQMVSAGKDIENLGKVLVGSRIVYFSSLDSKVLKACGQEPLLASSVDGVTAGNAAATAVANGGGKGRHGTAQVEGGGAGQRRREEAPTRREDEAANEVEFEMSEEKMHTTKETEAETREGWEAPAARLSTEELVAALEAKTSEGSLLQRRVRERLLEAQAEGARRAHALASSSSAAVPPPSLEASDLYGNWKDSYGNTVRVRWSDSSQMHLLATLSRRRRQDIRLSLWRAPDGSTWYCGDAGLATNDDSLSEDQIAWVFPDGQVSVWTWDGSGDDGFYNAPEPRQGRGLLAQEMQHHLRDQSSRKMPSPRELPPPQPQPWPEAPDLRRGPTSLAHEMPPPQELPPPGPQPWPEAWQQSSASVFYTESCGGFNGLKFPPTMLSQGLVPVSAQPSQSLKLPSVLPSQAVVPVIAMPMMPSFTGFWLPPPCNDYSAPCM